MNTPNAPHPDTYGIRRNGGHPLPPLAVSHAIEHATEPTDLEQIAKWFRYLPYDDFKTWAIEVLGDKTVEKPGDLADLVNEWQKRMTGGAA